MDFANEFDVAAPVDEVYAALLDVERVAPAMPGAEIQEQVGDATYKTLLKVKVGPATMQWRADVAVVEQDASAHTATLSVNAREARGQGTAVAQILIALTERDGGTHGTLNSSVDIAGKAGAMDESLFQDVSDRLVSQFAGNLATMLGGPALASSTETVVREVPAEPIAETKVHEVPAEPEDDDDTAERDALVMEAEAAADAPEPEPEPEPDPIPAASGAGASGAGGAAGAAADAVANAAAAAVDEAAESVDTEPPKAEPPKPQPPAKAELDVGALAAQAAKDRAPDPKLIAAVVALIFGLLLIRRRAKRS